MFRELVRAILKYDNEHSLLTSQLIDTLKKDIREDAIHAFEQSQPLIEKYSHLFQTSTSFVDFLFRLCGVDLESRASSKNNDTDSSFKEEIQNLKKNITQLERELERFKKNESTVQPCDSWEEDRQFSKLKQSHRNDMDALKEEIEYIKKKCEKEKTSLQRSLDEARFNSEKYEKELRECQKKFHELDLENTSLQRNLTETEQSKSNMQREMEKLKSLHDQNQREKSLALTVHQTEQMSLNNTIGQMNNVIQLYENQLKNIRHHFQMLSRQGLFNHPSVKTDNTYQSFMSMIFSSPTPLPESLPLPTTPLQPIQAPPIVLSYPQPPPPPNNAMVLSPYSQVPTLPVKDAILPNLLTPTNDVVMENACDEEQKKNLKLTQCLGELNETRQNRDQWEREAQKLKLQIDEKEKSANQPYSTNKHILAKIKQIVHKMHEMNLFKIFTLSQKLSMAPLFENFNTDIDRSLYDNKQLETIVGEFLDLNVSPSTLKLGLRSETVEKYWEALEQKMDDLVSREKEMFESPLQITEMNTDLEDCRKELEQVRQEKNFEVDRLKMNLEQCQTALENLRHDNKVQLHGLILERDDELKHLEEIVNKLKTEKSASEKLQQEYNEFKRYFDAHSQEVTTLNNKLELGSKELSKVRQELDAFYNENSGLKDDISKLQTHLDQKTQLCAQYETDLNELQQKWIDRENALTGGLFQNFSAEEPIVSSPIDEEEKVSPLKDSESMEITIQSNVLVKEKEQEIQNLKEKLHIAQIQIEEYERFINYKKLELDIIDKERHEANMKLEERGTESVHFQLELDNAIKTIEELQNVSQQKETVISELRKEIQQSSTQIIERVIGILRPIIKPKHATIENFYDGLRFTTNRIVGMKKNYREMEDNIKTLEKQLNEKSSEEMKIRSLFSFLKVQEGEPIEMSFEEFVQKVDDWIKTCHANQISFETMKLKLEAQIMEENTKCVDLKSKYDETLRNQEENYAKLEKTYEEYHKWIKTVQEHFIKLYPHHQDKWDTHIIPDITDTLTHLQSLQNHLTDQMNILECHFKTVKFNYYENFAVLLIKAAVQRENNDDDYTSVDETEYEQDEKKKRKIVKQNPKQKSNTSSPSKRSKKKCELDEDKITIASLKAKLKRVENERHICISNLNELKNEMDVLKNMAPNLVYASSTSSGGVELQNMKHLFLSLFVHYFRSRWNAMILNEEAFEKYEISKFLARIRKVVNDPQSEICALAIRYMYMDINAFTGSNISMLNEERQSTEEYLDKCVEEAQRFIESAVVRHGKAEKILGALSDREDLLIYLERYSGLDEAIERLKKLEQHRGFV